MTAGPYWVELALAAQRQVRKLSHATARRVLLELANLGTNPWPPGCRAMVGQSQRWRVRVHGAGDYRIAYEIQDQRLLVLVVAVAHRREIYASRHLTATEPR